MTHDHSIKNRGVRVLSAAASTTSAAACIATPAPTTAPATAIAATRSTAAPRRLALLFALPGKAVGTDVADRSLHRIGLVGAARLTVVPLEAGLTVATVAAAAATTAGLATAARTTGRSAIATTGAAPAIAARCLPVAEWIWDGRLARIATRTARVPVVPVAASLLVPVVAAPTLRALAARTMALPLSEPRPRRTLGTATRCIEQ